jgi:arsenite-transporting ATPase
VRELAEKTDVGRLASPSLLKLIYDAARPNGRTSEGKMSTEIWNEIEQILEVIYQSSEKNYVTQCMHTLLLAK